jgi:hypothetical protein
LHGLDASRKSRSCLRIISYGQLLWQKKAGRAGPAEEIETFTAVLVAASGLRTPALVYQDGSVRGPTIDYAGPCSPPEQHTLDAGTITLDGPGFGPLSAVATVLNRRTVIRADLPRGTIRPGLFKVRASGGADVGPFESSIEIGSPIQVTTPIPPGTAFSPLRAMTVTWTGGDEGAWVTLRMVCHRGSVDRYTETMTRASAAKITLGWDGRFLPAPHGSGLEIVLEVTPDPPQEAAIRAAGLTLGGRHSWKYTYRFPGVVIRK